MKHTDQSVGRFDDKIYQTQKTVALDLLKHYQRELNMYLYVLFGLTENFSLLNEVPRDLKVPFNF